MELNNDRNAGRSILSAYFNVHVAPSASSPTMVACSPTQINYVQYIEYHFCVYNVKQRLAVKESLRYVLLYVLDLCTLYKRQTERGCFFNSTAWKRS